MLTDVGRIISSHAQLNHDGHGKWGLGHISHSGVLMLCAAWELYIEEVMLEVLPISQEKSTTQKISHKVCKKNYQVAGP